MCIISVAPKGVKKDTEEVYNFIRQGAKSNSSGSGFMFKRSGSNVVNIDKGYFNVEELIKSLKEYNLQEDDELVVHHRIPTSGNVNNLNCHPFVISTKHNEVIMLKGEINKPCMAHNGVFSKIDKYESLNKDFSDTYTFAKHIMSKKPIMSIFLHERDLFDVCMDNIIGRDKIAILFPDRDIEMVGNWVKDNGYFHSNTGYKSYIYDRGGSSSNNREYYGYGNFFDNDEYWNEKPNNQNCSIALYKKKDLLFDHKTIKLDNNNCKDFYYIVKSKYNLCPEEWRKQLDKYELDEIDLTSYNQILSAVTDAGGFSIRKGLPIEDIQTNYYYIPKDDKYSVYSSYSILLEKKLVHSRNSIKTLKKQLDKGYKRGPSDLILFKPDGVLYQKRVLKMYYDYISNDFKIKKDLSQLLHD